jgi:hypothetical protein
MINFKKISAISLLTYLIGSSLIVKPAFADNGPITVTIENPGIQSTQLPSNDYYTIDFNDQSGTTGFSKTNNGTIYTYSSELNVRERDQWGGANETKYITQDDGKNTVRLTVSQEQKYFGFWWSAGDPYNKIIFKKNGQEIAFFRTEDLVSFINSSGVNDPQAYYGNPNGGYGETGHLEEPFSYVNVFFDDQAYDEIVIETLTNNGAKFESDNHTFSANNQLIRGLPIPINPAIPSSPD